MKSILALAGGKDVAGDTAADPPPDRTAVQAMARAARCALMERIGVFLVAHDLDITPANLARAHAAFCGANRDLGQAIEEREAMGKPMTQLWFESVAPDHDAGEDIRVEIDHLASGLHESIALFAHTARDARSAAADYRSALTRQTEAMDASAAAHHLFARVAELTRAMLERTQQAEEKMQRSESEAVELRKHLEEAQRVAEIDHLTGLPNRRAFEALLEKLCGEARTAGEALCVAFCDIDNFKPVNDIHGHDTGDRVLRMVARALEEGSDEDCHVARHGGEEFVLVFRGLSPADAQASLDCIRRTLACRPFVNRSTDEPIGTITFSGGVADVFAYKDHDEALRAADEALYRAKRNGRNRIELAG